MLFPAEMEAAPPMATLADMKGDADASVEHFFERYAKELPAALADKCRRVGTTFLSRYGRARLGKLFALSAGNAREVLQTCELDPGWLETIEEMAGFTFRDHSVPDSATLLCAVSEVPGSSREGWPLPSWWKPNVKAEKKRPDTISEELGKEICDETIPEGIFTKCIDTADPLCTAIEEREIEAMSSSLLSYYASRFGHIRFGVPLCRHLGKKLGHRLPILPAYGETPGNQRRWHKILWNKARNYSHARPSHSNQPPPRCAADAVVRPRAEGIRDPARCARHRHDRGGQDTPRVVETVRDRPRGGRVGLWPVHLQRGDAHPDAERYA